jgi:NAD dependent epimerase/dehydratase family enzyme
MLLGGVKAAPKKLLESGFKFEHETIEDALESAVKESI